MPGGETADSRPRFLLLEPGPVVPDEGHQRGDTDLLDANGMTKIVSYVLSGRQARKGKGPVGDYQSRVLCLADWRRRGAAHDLAPLGHQFPSTSRPDFQPLPKDALGAAFTLQPGGCQLSEADKGDLLQTNLGGFGTPAGTAVSGGGGAAGGGAGPAVAPSAGGAAAVPITKIKLKVKAAGDKKGVSLRLGAEGRLAVKLAAEVEAAALIQLVNARAARRAELRRRAGAGAATAGDCSR